MIWNYLVKLNIDIPDNPAVTPKDLHWKNSCTLIPGHMYRIVHKQHFLY